MADRKRRTENAPTRQMWRRSLIVLFAVIFVAFLIILGRLLWVQVFENTAWQTRAVEQQMSDSIVSPNRGTIFDTNGDTLAESMQVWTVIMSPKNIETEEQRQKIANDLSGLLGVDKDTLYKKTQRADSQYEKVKEKIERPLAEQMIAWADENDMNGVFRLITDYKRVYPFGSLLSCVLGFTGTDNTGLYGLEAEYNSVLSGKAGRIVTAKNGQDEDMPTKMAYEKTVDAEDGHGLVLTIDNTVQHYAEKYLEEAVAETGATNRAAAIVMNVKTGAIVAMATKGDFNPNDPMTITDPNDLTALAALSGDERTNAVIAAQEKQWTNKAIAEYYEPGSVFKMFTSSMALEEGVATENDTFFCSGAETILDTTVQCSVYPGAHGAQSFEQALCNSCNPAFIQIGQRIGRELFFKYYTGFGFTEKTGIDMLSEAAISQSLYHSEADLDPVQLSVSAMGQTFKVTPIQVITAMAAVANGGQLLQPYVVRQELAADGSVLSNTTASVKRQVISKETSRKVSKMLERNAIDGGAVNFYIAGYRTAGKTGTADKTEITTSSEVVASFGGFAPADDPQYAVLVMIDQPQVPNHYGGTIAAPVARKIFEDALPYLGVEPKYTNEELAELSRTTPSVVGTSLAEAEAAVVANDLECRVIGYGDIVIKQIPEAGQFIPASGMVVLYTEEVTEADYVTVPDFTNMTVSEANWTANACGINVQLAGAGLDTGAALAGSQSVPPDSKVPAGTVIVVEFVHSDTIE